VADNADIHRIRAFVPQPPADAVLAKGLDLKVPVAAADLLMDDLLQDPGWNPFFLSSAGDIYKIVVCHDV
jgi:hypothetical protein